ncbi:SDR family NAD(P)-dependent oxidoreductase [Kineosporia babensis]|uniref:SDR family oxidoreductase n=1 Tax=Kineosporia babensis TaxID=499548 RepID=A0A9X1NIV6_9ACTN|nr:SDR family NAD(P)-dependent oxidoreductase [Kineosporia babensis]MCD5314031.1 SDR family oxidoreductase [Kineosporia babensis]
MTDEQFKAKTVLVTGAARGIGRAAVVEFARRGAQVVAADLDGDALAVLGREHPDAKTVVADVAQEADVQAMVAAAVDRFGSLDVLIANAGIIPMAPLLETSTADWEQVMAIDGRGMFLSCRYAAEQMVPAGSGAIVCVSSISGMAGQSGQSAYGAAKFVATGLVKHLAVELAPAGIRVNGVAPGTIRTDRVVALETEPGGPEYLADIVRKHPLGRLGEPSEVAAAMAFLASDESSFVTGAVLAVDGGYLAQ